MISDLTGVSAEKHKAERMGVVKFPLRLMWILDNKDYNHIVRWNDDGSSFLIVDFEALTKNIYPVFFAKREIEPTSFERRLMRWNFKKGGRPNVWFNAQFHQGGLTLCEGIVHKDGPNKNTNKNPDSSSTTASMNHDTSTQHNSNARNFCDTNGFNFATLRSREELRLQLMRQTRQKKTIRNLSGISLDHRSFPARTSIQPARKRDYSRLQHADVASVEYPPSGHARTYADAMQQLQIQLCTAEKKIPSMDEPSSLQQEYGALQTILYEKAYQNHVEQQLPFVGVTTLRNQVLLNIPPSSLQRQHLIETARPRNLPADQSNASIFNSNGVNLASSGHQCQNQLATTESLRRLNMTPETIYRRLVNPQRKQKQEHHRRLLCAANGESISNRIRQSVRSSHFYQQQHGPREYGHFRERFLPESKGFSQHHHFM